MATNVKEKPKSFISDEDMAKLESGSSAAPKFISDDEMASIDKPKMSGGEAALVGLQKGTTFGFRPAIAGAAGAVGSVVGNLSTSLPNEGLSEKLKRTWNSISPSYEEARKGAIEQQDQAQEEHPYLTAVGDVAGSALTIPFAAGNSLRGAAALSATQGAGRAISEGEDLKDAAHKFAEGTATGLIGYGVGKGIEAASPLIGKAASYAGDKVKSGALKTASALTGVSEKEIQTYASRAKEVNDLLKSSDGSISAAADRVRNKVSKEIQSARQNLNSQISTALKDPKYADVKIDGSPIVQKLSDEIEKIGETATNFRPNEVVALHELRSTLVKSLDKDGMVSPVVLNDIKQELQKAAQGSYANGMVIFPRGDLAAKGAKSAAAEARKILNEAVPEIGKANNQLSLLHAIEDNMNKNLIKEGKPEAALLAAGSGANPRNAKILSSLDAITGGSATKGAENLAAARSFGNTQILPVDSTGKAVARMLTGAGAGSLVGNPLLGAAATSPMALKQVLNVGRLVSGAAKGTGEAISSGGASLSKVLGTQQGGSAILDSATGARDSAIRRRMQILEDLKKFGRK